MVMKKLQDHHITTLCCLLYTEVGHRSRQQQKPEAHPLTVVVGATRWYKKTLHAVAKVNCYL